MTLATLTLIAVTAQVQVHTADTNLVLSTAEMPLLFSDGIFSATDLDATREVLQVAGIDTTGHFCLFAANTAQGLSVVLLLDAPDAGDPGDTTPVGLGVETLLNGGADMLENIDAGGWWYEYDLPEGLLGTGTLQWVHGESGAALAWTGLSAISTIDLSMFDVDGIQGALDSPVLQILNAGETWSVAHEVDFDSNDAINLTMDVVPVPAPGMLVLAACAVRRRRRR